MTLGGIAGLIAAVAFVALVGMVAVPLWKTGRVLDELRQTVHDIGEESVPILTELQDTVRVTNGEIGRLGQVTDEVACSARTRRRCPRTRPRSRACSPTRSAPPIIKVASLAHGIKAGFTGGGRRPAELEQKG